MYKTMIVSDYDGTIKNDKELLYEIIKKTNYLLEKEVCFMISTGRLYDSMYLEIEKYNILFSYLSLANGNILMDKNYDLIWEEKVSESPIKLFKDYYKYILSISEKDAFGIESTKNTVEYCLEIDSNPVVRKSIVNILLNSKTFDYCTDGNNKYKIHIFNKSDKVKTIEILKDITKVRKEDIFVAGDGPNDYTMLKEYNGYKIGNSNINIEENFTVFNSYSEFLETIEKKLVKRL